MAIYQSNDHGRVVIGNSYRSSNLYVNGIVKAHQIEVKLTNWSDFVFADDYQLNSLAEVEAYITKNKHLPNVPSEKEVLENGVNLGEMDAILLRKIEELTLYVIELENRIKQIEKIN
jgi:hypothetical protein